MWKAKKTTEKNDRKKQTVETQKLKLNDHYNKEWRPASYRKYSTS